MSPGAQRSTCKERAAKKGPREDEFAIAVDSSIRGNAVGTL
jgi:hypothetical protein